MLLQRLEALPVGSFHYKLLFITGLGWLFDAMDTGLIGFVLPVLGKEWGLAATQMGAIGSIGLVGMALGAVVAGSIADRFGRKTVFSATVIMYSIATGLCAISWSSIQRQERGCGRMADRAMAEAPRGLVARAGAYMASCSAISTLVRSAILIPL